MTLEYTNPLDAFRSHSYHFTLSVANSTEAFRKIVSNNGKSMLHAINNVSPGGRFAVEDQEAYLLVDTRRFSQYTITDVEMSHIYGTGTIENPSRPASELTMKLFDTTGLTFFDMLMDIFKQKLQTTRASAFFLLSIFFHGHNDSGQTHVVSTCHMPLMLVNLNFDFTHAGSEFHLSFVELEGSPQKGTQFQQLDGLGTVKSISSKLCGTNTIGSLITDLETQLNVQSLTTYQKLNGATNTQAKGKLVQYMITVPNTEEFKWADMLVEAAPVSVVNEKTFISNPIPGTEMIATGKPIPPVTPPEKQYTQLSFAENLPITDAIKYILESSVEFMKQTSEERIKAGTAVTFKVLTSVTSDDTTYMIHFDIYPYRLPKTTTQQFQSLIAYDYIFSGKNSHIKDLKIHYDPAAVALEQDLDLGPGRLDSNAEAGAKLSNVDKASDSSVKSSGGTYSNLRANDPVFVPYRTEDQKTNFGSLRRTNMSDDQLLEAQRIRQTYTKNYASLHFVSAIAMDMTIRGNPNFIKKFSDRADPTGRGPIPAHPKIIDRISLNKLFGTSKTTAQANFTNTILPGFATAKQKYINEFINPRIKSFLKMTKDPLLNTVDVATLPILLKINIFAPNVDWSGNYTDPNNLFTNRYFYNGAFSLLMIQTTFRSGDFDQTMTVIPYAIDDSFFSQK